MWGVEECLILLYTGLGKSLQKAVLTEVFDPLDEPEAFHTIP